MGICELNMTYILLQLQQYQDLWDGKSKSRAKKHEHDENVQHYPATLFGSPSHEQHIPVQCQ